jgi:hypothetical protein
MQEERVPEAQRKNESNQWPKKSFTFTSVFACALHCRRLRIASRGTQIQRSFHHNTTKRKAREKEKKKRKKNLHTFDIPPRKTKLIPSLHHPALIAQAMVRRRVRDVQAEVEHAGRVMAGSVQEERKERRLVHHDDEQA